VRVDAGSSLKTEWVDDPDVVAPEWDSLADRVGAAPWLRPGWTKAWLGAFGKGTPQIATVRRAGALVGIAPLLARAGVLRSPTNWHTPEFGFLVEDLHSGAELARALFERRPRRISLGFLDRDRPGFEESRRAAASAGYRVLARPLQRSPFVEIRGSAEAYFDRLVQKQLSNVRRRRRRLAESAAVSFSIEDGTERLDELLEEGFRVESSGWKGAHGTAINSRDDTLRFYTEIAHWAAGRGWLRLAYLRVDGLPIAFEFLLEAEGILYDVKQGYDERYRRYSPGHQLHLELIEYSFGSGVRSYEFLGADDPAKRVWAGGVRDRMLFQAFAPSLAGTVEWGAFGYVRPAAKRVLARLRR
jgi:CelD/BcsL family acetyltransferase involved in cellulose biosynthesis